MGGWNRSNEALPSSSRKGSSSRSSLKGSIVKGIAAGIFVLAISVGVYWFFSRSEAMPTPSDKPRKTNRPVAVGTNATVRHAQVVTTNIVDKTKPHPAYLQKNQNPKLPPKRYIPSIEEVEAAHLGPDGKPKKVAIYKSGLEQTMSAIFSTKLGSPPPMLPSIPSQVTPKQLEKFLGTAFEYDKDAPLAVRENRILMQQVKDEFKKYVDDGGDPQKFISYYYQELKTANEEWKTAQKMVVEMSRNGEDAEVVRQFRDRANKMLGERGIKPLVLPRSVRAHLGEE